MKSKVIVLLLKKYILQIAVVAIWFFSGIIWIFNRAPALPLDIDEAGYIGFAVRNCKNLISNGLPGFVNAVLSRQTFAPLQPFIGTVFGCTTNPNLELIIPLLASTFFIWEFMRLQNHPFFGLLFIVICPVYLQFSTNFGFAMLSSTAFALSALYATHSNFFEDLRYSIYSGAALSIALLSRTMFSAFFVIEIVAEIIILLFFFRKNSLLRIRNFTISISLPLLIAGPWYISHWNSVFGYLTSFGYGTHAKEYGTVSGIFNWTAWKFEWLVFSQNYFTTISLFGIFLLLGLLIFQLSRQLRKYLKRSENLLFKNERYVMLHRIKMDALPGIFYFLLCFGMFLAMSSTMNVTSAGLLPTLLILALVISFATEFVVVPNFLRVVGSSFVFLILISVCLIEFRPNQILKLGSSTYIKATSARSGYYLARGFDSSGSNGINSLNSKKWVLSINNLAKNGRNSHCLVFGFRHSILNVNSVNLQLYYDNAELSYLTQIDPIQTSSPADYVKWIKSFPTDCLVFTDSSVKGQFPPAPNLSFLTQALTSQDYAAKQIEKLPDGSVISVWKLKSQLP